MYSSLAKCVIFNVQLPHFHLNDHKSNASNLSKSKIIFIFEYSYTLDSYFLLLFIFLSTSSYSLHIQANNNSTFEFKILNQKIKFIQNMEVYMKLIYVQKKVSNTVYWTKCWNSIAQYINLVPCQIAGIEIGMEIIPRKW